MLITLSTDRPEANSPTQAGRGLVRCFYGILFLVLVAGCHKEAPAPRPSPQECIDEIAARIKDLPQKPVLPTLDGQAVNLQEFFNACARKRPDCALYAKFYYWASEVKEIESKSSAGRVRHKIRMYYNPVSICLPEKVNPGRTHGDVAEIYDSNGIFMGLAVYMGEGLYVTLPYSGYRGTKRIPL